MDRVTCYKDGSFETIPAKKTDKKESTTKQRKDAHGVEKKDKAQKLKSGIAGDTELIKTLQNKSTRKVSNSSTVTSENNMVAPHLPPNEIAGIIDEESSQMDTGSVNNSTTQAGEKETNALCHCPSCPIHQMGM